jgi:hypothetical protein
VQKTPATPALTGSRKPFPLLRPGMLLRGRSAVAQSISGGGQLSREQFNLLGHFDTIVSAILDSGYERADQFYRNAAKLAATLVAMALAAVGGGLIYHSGYPSLPISGYLRSSDFLVALLIGAISTPLAPVAKDLSTALSTAVGAVGAVKR